MGYVLWAVSLFAIALLLFALEIFIPSGGLIGLCAGLSLVGGIVLLFIADTTMGLVGTIVTLVAVPFLFMLALKVWPTTPFARRLTLGDPMPEQRGDDDVDYPPPAPPHPLLGATGTAITDLHPIGTCLFEGKREQCLAEGGVIEKGTSIQVVYADGMQIKVRPVDDEDA